MPVEEQLIQHHETKVTYISKRKQQSCRKKNLRSIIQVKNIQNGHCEEAQENSERHYNEIKNNIIVQEESFTKETEANSRAEELD